jgi:BCD family chlorophyll transporter-like MFS transporter
MNLAPKDQSGLALGTWGAVQATAAGLGMALGGIIRDLVDLLGGAVVTSYASVYALELVVLIFTIFVVSPLVRPIPLSQFPSEHRS